MRRFGRSLLSFVVLLIVFGFLTGSLSQSQIESPNAPRIIYIQLPKGRCVAAPPGLPADRCPGPAAIVNWIAADGRDFIGSIGYEDSDKDIIKVTFRVVEVTGEGSFRRDQTFSFEPPLGGQAADRGAFDFRIFSTAPQDVTLSVILEDSKKNTSQPKIFSFKAVGSDPVITKIEFSPEIPIGAPRELKINFIDREGDLSLVTLQPPSIGRLTTCQRLRQEGAQEIRDSLLGAVDVSQEALGQQEGQLTFRVVCPNAQRVQVRVALSDIRGNQNNPSLLRQPETFEFIVGRQLTADLYFLDQFGSPGGDPGQFSSPQGLAVDSLNRIFVADTANHRIQIFDQDRLRRPGKPPLYIWGSRCLLREGCTDPDGGGPLVPGEAQFDGATDVAIDGENNVYVVDSGNNVIQKFKIDTACTSPLKPVVPGVCFVTKWGSRGSAAGLFETPLSLAVDSKNRVLYVTDKLNHRVQKFDLNGVFQRAWGSRCELERASDPRSGCTDPDGTGPLQVGDGQFNEPTSVAVDSAGNVYVADSGNHRIQKFDPNGKFLARWGRRGASTAQFETPRGLTIDGKGDILVVDQGNDRVQKFTNDGRFLELWGDSGKTEGRFDFPQDIGIDAEGNIYIVELLSHRAQKLGRLP
ncbi:SMP-30/gluconolactonase/LRE family protein [Candidatus Acetothermia bacterium]|nr:SMP-30/gluconolactonase/LRE family protein [Candidatus Acetothermia bacterium]MCI2431666.1 SMP-30/gluconolactonase/LRE family protein [Candidatus Acetothermia bacterium]MCI2436382.1 SMP-30/gluconolactonase/LRE family protein [Candidatus Acetothermia bacterium]